MIELVRRAKRELTLVLERETIAAYDRAGALVARVGERDGAPALIGGALAVAGVIATLFLVFFVDPLGQP